MMTEVLPASPAEGGPTFSGLRRTSSHGFLQTDLAKSYLHASSPQHSYDGRDFARRASASLPSSAPPSPQLSQATFSTRPSISSTPASSISFDTKPEFDIAGEQKENDILFPSYDGLGQTPHDDEAADSAVVAPPTSSPDVEDIPMLRPRTGSEDVPVSAGDDHAIEVEPTRHVDYLSHEWREEDIWSSWRYIVSKRGVFSNSVRLENASWRTWAKSKHKLQTVSAEKLNWLKDCDVTWLYGPLQTDAKNQLSVGSTPLAPSQLHPSSSFLNKKPILKKRSTSEAILQRSISSHSLLKHAGAILKAQQASPSKARPSFQRAMSDFTHPVFSRSSAHNTPFAEDTFNFPSAKPSLNSSASSSGMTSPGERRHIHFNNEVVQCIAVERQGGDYDEDEGPSVYHEDEDDGIVMMKPSRPKLSARSTPRGSFSNEGKTIAPLPSTTLRGDSPEPSQFLTPKVDGGWSPRPGLPQSPSQETIRPSRPSANFLLDDDDEAGDLSWEPSGRSYACSSGASDHDSDEDETDPGPGMHRTPSGMFMPYDEDEDETAMNNSLFGRVVDTVNTARDIAHVIWNVGWRG